MQRFSFPGPILWHFWDHTVQFVHENKSAHGRNAHHQWEQNRTKSPGTQIKEAPISKVLSNISGFVGLCSRGIQFSWNLWAIGQSLLVLPVYSPEMGRVTSKLYVDRQSTQKIYLLESFFKQQQKRYRTRLWNNICGNYLLSWWSIDIYFNLLEGRLLHWTMLRLKQWEYPVLPNQGKKHDQTEITEYCAHTHMCIYIYVCMYT